MDAYCAVIQLHNLGYQLIALEGDHVAIKPAARAEDAELIRAIRKEARAACRAIPHLPHLCAVIMPGILKEYAADLFRIMQANQQLQIVAIRYCRSTGATEWVYVPISDTARRTMNEIREDKWGECYECKTEREQGGN